MSIRDDILNHIQSLNGSALIAKRGWKTKMLHFWRSPELRVLGGFIPLLSALPTLALMVAREGGIPSDPFFPFLIALMSTIGCVWGLAWAVTTHVSKFNSAHPRQWEHIVDNAEDLLKINNTHADDVASIVELLNDERVSYHWANEMIQLMQRWISEEQQSKIQQKQMARIDGLKTRHNNTVVVDEEDLKIDILEHDEILSKEIPCDKQKSRDM